MRFIIHMTLIVILCVAQQSFAKKKLPTLQELEKETKHFLLTDKKEIKIVQVDTTIPLYYAYAYITLDIPFEKAAPYILDIENYENTFDPLLDVHSAHDPRWPDLDIHYIEGKTSVIHGWGIGVLEEMKYRENIYIRIKIRPAPRRLVNEYKRKLRGKIKYYIKNVHIDGMLIRVDENTCRIGIRGITSTNKPMPLWIVNIIMKIALPNLLDDVGKRVKEDQKAARKKK